MARRGIWIILGVALLLRAALLLASWGHPEHFFTPDSHDYHLLAHNLLEKGVFTRTGQPELFRAPGYPGFLAAMYWLSGDHVQLALAVQILLDVLQVYLVYTLGRWLCGEKVGLVAAGIQAISPVAIVGSVRILSEGLFGLCMTGSLVLLVKLYQGAMARPPSKLAMGRDGEDTSQTKKRGQACPPCMQGAWLALAAGVVLGIGCLIRPIGLPLAFLVAIVLLISRLKRPLAKADRPEGPTEGSRGREPTVSDRARMREMVPSGGTAFPGCAAQARKLVPPKPSTSVILARPLSGFSSALLWPAMFLLGALVVVGPWIARNRAQTGYAQLAGVGDYNLFYCNALVLLNAYPDLPLNDAQQNLLRIKQSYPDWPTGQPRYLNDPDFLRDCRRQGLGLILAHPVRYAWVHFKTAWNIFLPAATDVLEVLGITSGGKGTLAILQQQGLLVAVRHYFGGQLWPLLFCVPMILITLAKYVLALKACVRTLRLHMPAAWWLLWVVFLYLAFTPGPVALPRFRVPIAALICLAAAAGLLGHRGHRERRE